MFFPRLRSGALALAVALAAVACDHRAGDAGDAGASTASDASTASADAGAPADPRVASGAAAFAKYCALCHGPNATGYAADHAPSLVSETFLATATDDFLARGIREGRPGTAMAGYARDRGGPLEDVEVSALIAFLRSKSSARVALPPTPPRGVPARGEALYEVTCRRCHGTQKQRGDAVHLANPAFLSAASDAFLRYAVLHGRPGTPMPPFAEALGEGPIDDIVSFLRTWALPPPEPPQRPAPPPPVPLGPVVINPGGNAPLFTLREDRFVPVDQLKKALDAKKRVVVIDARPSSDWLVMHIPGSISIPYYEMTPLDAVPKDGTWVLAYCACPHHASGVVVDELRKRGYKHTAVIDEGILEWQKRGYPVAGSGPPPGAFPPPPVPALLGPIGPPFPATAPFPGPGGPVPFSATGGPVPFSATGGPVPFSATTAPAPSSATALPTPH